MWKTLLLSIAISNPHYLMFLDSPHEVFRKKNDLSCLTDWEGKKANPRPLVCFIYMQLYCYSLPISSSTFILKQTHFWSSFLPLHSLFYSISYCWLQATTLLFPAYISTHRPCTAAINMIAKKKRVQSANSFVILNLCYLSKGEHLVWSIMKNNGNLSQVGGGVAEQSLLSTAGRIRERQRTAQVPRLVLHLVCWRVKLCTGECCRSPHLVMMCPWSGQPRLYVLLEQFIRVFLTIAFSCEDESLMLEEQPLR